MKKKSFVLYNDFHTYVSKMSDEQAGKLMKAIFNFVNDVEQDLDAITDLIFEPIKQHLIRDNNKYEDKCLKNKENAKKRWNNANAYDRMQSHQVASSRNANHADNDIDNESDSESDIDSESENVIEKNKNSTSFKKKLNKKKEELSLFEKTLKDFKDMRKKIKKPLTARGEKLILSKLESIAGDDEDQKIEILEQSIMNCYQGVFPLNKNKNAVDDNKGKSIADMEKELVQKAKTMPWIKNAIEG
jgi:hypothetical protein